MPAQHLDGDPESIACRGSLIPFFSTFHFVLYVVIADYLGLIILVPDTDDLFLVCILILSVF